MTIGSLKSTAERAFPASRDIHEATEGKPLTVSSGLKDLLKFPTLKKYVPAALLLREMAWRFWHHGEREVRLLKKLIPRGTNGIDVGAASGLYAYHLSRLCERVFAYEPNPEWVSWLSRAVPRNVAVFDVALSNRSGTAVLSIPPPSMESLEGDLTLRCPQAASIEKQFEGVPCDRIDVPTRRLDEYRHQNIGFIKIDVEGHELAVLEGAAQTLKNCSPVLLVEIESRHIKRNVREEFDLIEAMGYTGHFLLETTLRPVNEFSLERHQSLAFPRGSLPYINNFIFLPKL
jgi:FkbM family methyltransferase